MLPGGATVPGWVFYPHKSCAFAGHTKGKVERSIQYIRHAFFAARVLSALDRLNQELDTWIAEVAHQRPRPRDPERISVEVAFEQEREHLLPLPEHPHPCALMKSVASGKTPYIRFDLNDYSIPHKLVRKPLTLIASTNEIRLVDGLGKEVARHPRCWSRGEVVQNDDHLAGLAETKRAGQALIGRDRLFFHCPSADRLIEAVARRGLPLRAQTTHLNRLLDRYGAETLEAALKKAIEQNAFSAASVAHILDQWSRSKGEAPPLEPIQHTDPRVHTLRVRNHDLRSYDQLTRDHPEEDES